MNEVIINSIHKIANHIYKKRGYAVTVKREDVAVVLQATNLLINKIEEDNNGEDQGKGNRNKGN